jgi:F-type H+-transporting ATPase subunit c
MGVSVAGAAIGQGLVGSKALESMARQPELAGKIRTAMILALGLIESLAIYSLLIAFMLLGKL